MRTRVVSNGRRHHTRRHLTFNGTSVLLVDPPAGNALQPIEGSKSSAASRRSRSSFSLSVVADRMSVLAVPKR